jgi:hypothetical protein
MHCSCSEVNSLGSRTQCSHLFVSPASKCRNNWGGICSVASSIFPSLFPSVMFCTSLLLMWQCKSCLPVKHSCKARVSVLNGASQLSAGGSVRLLMAPSPVDRLSLRPAASPAHHHAWQLSRVTTSSTPGQESLHSDRWTQIYPDSKPRKNVCRGHGSQDRAWRTAVLSQAPVSWCLILEQTTFVRSISHRLPCHLQRSCWWGGDSFYK